MCRKFLRGDKRKDEETTNHVEDTTQYEAARKVFRREKEKQKQKEVVARERCRNFFIYSVPFPFPSFIFFYFIILNFYM